MVLEACIQPVARLDFYPEPGCERLAGGKEAVHGRTVGVWPQPAYQDSVEKGAKSSMGVPPISVSSPFHARS